MTEEEQEWEDQDISWHDVLTNMMESSAMSSMDGGCCKVFLVLMVYGRPSLESISKKTGFRLKKLMRFIDQLENRGFIEKSESDRYVITEFYRQLKWR